MPTIGRGESKTRGRLHFTALLIDGQTTGGRNFGPKTRLWGESRKHRIAGCYTAIELKPDDSFAQKYTAPYRDALKPGKHDDPEILHPKANLLFQNASAEAGIDRTLCACDRYGTEPVETHSGWRIR
jgi:hypothetical protein